MSNETRQSSVEFAIAKLTMICACYNRGEMSADAFDWYHKKIVIEAKAMHKEEIKNSMSAAFIDGAKIGAITYESPYQNWEQYYDLTYGGNK
jgi:hypothetical protein